MTAAQEVPESEHLAAERAEVQRSVAAYTFDPPELAELREQAALAARNYFAAYVAHLEDGEHLRDRAMNLGLTPPELPRINRQSPLPRLARAVLEVSRDLLRRRWTQLTIDRVGAQGIWDA